jgi:hypothetical protein
MTYKDFRTVCHAGYIEHWWHDYKDFRTLFHAGYGVLSLENLTVNAAWKNSLCQEHMNAFCG